MDNIYINIFSWIDDDIIVIYTSIIMESTIMKRVL